MLGRALPLALLAVVGLLTYSNTFGVPFQFDDKTYIVENPAVKDPGLLREGFEKAGLSRNVRDTWKTRSVGYLSFALNYRLNGLDPWGYHVVNLAIHITNAFLVYSLLLLSFRTPVLRRSGLRERAAPLALSAALLFLAHPVQTQAVTYITQRFASLSAMFYLLALVSYAAARLSGKIPVSALFYVLSFASAVLAMNTKEISFTLPLAAALYEFSFFEGARGRRALYLVPLVLTMLIIPLGLMRIEGPVAEALADATRTQLDIKRGEYLLTEFRVVATYIRLLLLPVNQNLDYSYRIFRSFNNPQVLLSSAFLITLLLLTAYLYLRSRRPGEAGLRLAAFGVLWFFLTLSVESSVIALQDVIFEHRLYLPSIGFFTAVVTVAYLATEGRRRLGKAVMVMLALTVLALSAAAFERNGTWRGEISLWEDVVCKSPRKERGHYNLGNAYRKMEMPEEAAEHYRAAVALRPDFLDARFNLALVYLNTGELDEAAGEFGKVLEINPGDREARGLLDYVLWKKSKARVTRQSPERGGRGLK
jgi:tetratricopeptide (TPR) repeat protein